MVPQHAHAHVHPRLPRAPLARPQLDPIRIVGISGTLALNVVALLLLLVPVAPPGMLAPADGPVQPIRWIEDIPPPPPPPPPVEVAVTAPQPVPVPPSRAISRPEPAPSPAAPVAIAQGSLPPLAATEPASVAGPVAIEPAGPAAGMRLQYERAAPPPYPGVAIRSGLQGTVTLEVLVDVDGRPLQVRVHASSGHRVLDDAARRHVLRHWTFRPATRDGQPIQAIGLVPIDFNLERA